MTYNQVQAFKQRIVKSGIKAAAEFLANPQNPRRHPDKQRRALKVSLDTLGWIAPVIELTNGYLLDGHERVWQALALGDDTPVPHIVVDLTEDEARQALATFDYITYLAEYDKPILADLIATIDTTNEGLRELLDGMREEYQLLDNPLQAAGELVNDLPNRAAELQVKWQTARGQVWRVPSKSGRGVHRVMCGDSTAEDDVKRLMDGKRAGMMVTDPPYGVSYADKNAFLNSVTFGKRIEDRIEGDHLDKDGLKKLWKTAFTLAHQIMTPGAAVYCFMPQGGDQMMMMMMMSEAGIEPLHELIWVKNNHVLGRADYAYKHEPIMYGWKDGGHKFYGGFQTSVIEIDRPTRSDLHPTTKPVELIALLIQNSTERGMLVFDPFLGSGTTLIAAEQTSRVCYGMEIAPEYLAVILECAALAGLTPELEDFS